MIIIIKKVIVYLKVPSYANNLPLYFHYHYLIFHYTSIGPVLWPVTIPTSRIDLLVLEMHE